MLKTFELKNGIKVATYNLPNLKSVHLRTICKSGTLVENAKNAGTAHFVEHMLVQGIPSLPNATSIASYVESLAGTYGAYTDRLEIGFEITIPAIHLDDAMRISSEVFLEPLFTEDSLEKERRAIISELEQKIDSHWYKISKFFNSVRFTKEHPLGINTEDALKVVGRLNKENITGFFEQYFFPDNIYLLVVGNLTDQNTLELIKKHFGGYTSKKKFLGHPQISNEDFLNASVALRHDQNLTVNYLDLTFPSLNMMDSIIDRIKQMLLLVILGQLRNSRLFKLLRYDQGLVYDVSCGATTYPGLGYVYISSQVSLTQLDEVVSLIMKALSSYVTNGPTKEELDFAKNFLFNRWLMTFDHPTAIASWIGSLLLWEDKVRLPEEYVGMIENIGTQELIETMQNYWDFSKLNLTIQGSVENSIPNVKKFEGILADLKK